MRQTQSLREFHAEFHGEPMARAPSRLTLENLMFVGSAQNLERSRQAFDLEDRAVR